MGQWLSETNLLLNEYSNKAFYIISQGTLTLQWLKPCHKAYLYEYFGLPQNVVKCIYNRFSSTHNILFMLRSLNFTTFLWFLLSRSSKSMYLSIIYYRSKESQNIRCMLVVVWHYLYSHTMWTKKGNIEFEELIWVHDKY